MIMVSETAKYTMAPARSALPTIFRDSIRRLALQHFLLAA
jgi:hypothetical protein